MMYKVKVPVGPIKTVVNVMKMFMVVLHNKNQVKTVHFQCNSLRTLYGSCLDDLWDRL